MSILGSIIAFLVSNSAYAESIQSWKIFRNDNGYEIKVPDCWDIFVNDPDQDQALPKSKDIGIREGKTCARPRFHSEMPNMVSVSVWEKFSSDKKMEDHLRQFENTLKVGTKKNFGFKVFKLGSANTLMYAEPIGQGGVRWQMILYCPSRGAAELKGPAMDSSSPTFRDFLNRLKEGNLAPPEPENSILESIRCVDVKSNGKSAIKPK